MLDELQRLELYKQLNPNELTPQQLQKIEHEMKSQKSQTISDEYFDFKLWYHGFPSRQENFAEFIAKKLSNKGISKILEVGCGRTARLSRILSKKGFIMTCIDTKLEVQSNAYIEYIKGQFNYKNFDLTKFDYVIAQEPCDATEHVVRACTSQHIPFMMSLCGVPHRLISGKMPKDVYEWYDYLVSISPEELKLRYVKLDPFLKTPLLKTTKF